MLCIRLVRLNRKLTQAQFGRKTGLGTQNDVSNIELGRVQPTLRQLERAALRLGLDPAHADDLLHDFPEPLRPIIEPTDVPEPETVQ